MLMLFYENNINLDSQRLKFPQNNGPRSMNETVKECNSDVLPNVFTLLKLFDTLR